MHVSRPPSRWTPSPPSAAVAATAARRRIAGRHPVQLGRDRRLRACSPARGMRRRSAAHDFGDPIFSADARGDITTIGNVTTTCDPTYANAELERRGVGGGVQRRHLRRHRADELRGRTDGRRSTTGSRWRTSTSTATRPRSTRPPPASRSPTAPTVLWAGLHWNAATAVPLNADRRRLGLQGAAGQRRGPVPGAAHHAARAAGSVRARRRTGRRHHAATRGTTRTLADTVSYGGFVDVTDLVQRGGSGDYTVADVQSCRGFGGCFGSWSLTRRVRQRLPAGPEPQRLARLAAHDADPRRRHPAPSPCAGITPAAAAVRSAPASASSRPTATGAAGPTRSTSRRRPRPRGRRSPPSTGRSPPARATGSTPPSTPSASADPTPTPRPTCSRTSTRTSPSSRTAR